MTDFTPHPASFKDPSGFVFLENGRIYRQVNKRYAAQYDHLLQSGLYEALVSDHLLLPHREIPENRSGLPDWYKTLAPEPVPYLSYSYEWSYDELGDAALLTLALQRKAMAHQMVLKDATPFNIQFYRGKPVWIDTLSFEIYDHSQPWVAYRQFCEFFLFPLYLGFYLKTDLQKIMRVYMEGLPAAITARLLPLRSRFNMGVWLHVYLQHSVQKSESHLPAAKAEFSSRKLLNLIDHLESIIHRLLRRRKAGTGWSNYYTESISSREYLVAKESLFRSFCDRLPVGEVLDLGANDGYFSRILAEKGWQVIAVDADAHCINSLYRFVKEKKITRLLPLVMDITNPSPAIGFANREGTAFHERIKTGLVAALALIHHLSIGKNIPLANLAGYFADLAPHLIIEFVPREDKKVQEMLAHREDIFRDYTEYEFERHFSDYFDITEKQLIPGTLRTLYLMKRK